MPVSLTDKRLRIEFNRYPRAKTLEVYTISGKCFNDSTHVRVVEYYSGTRKDMEADMRAELSKVEIIDCEDPDCEMCNPSEDE